MNDFIVGIPTLDRPRLLGMCVDSILNSSVRPRAICIIDNGNYIDPGRFQNTLGVDVQVVKAPYNLGVAASWNLIHQIYAPLDLVIANDDVIFEPDTLATFRSVPPDKYLVFLKVPRSYGGYRCFLPHDRNWEWYPGGYSCFMIREPMFERIGPFDELLWPGYWEDTEFGKRCEAARMGPHMACVEGRFKHGVSHADVKPVADQIARPYVDPLAEWNRRRLMLKWGWNAKPPYVNRFAIPFDGKPVDELDLFLDKALLELKIYPQCHALAPHLPTVRAYATRAKSVVEFGRGLGIVTCALLAGRPDTLVSYDSQARMEPYKLMGLRGRTQLTFRELATAADGVEPAELMAIVDDRDPDHLQAALEQQAQASKYLLTVTEPPAAPAVERFCVQHPHWCKVHESGRVDQTRLLVFERGPRAEG